ncbi:MAG: hypothetical protein ACP5D3_01280 [Sulfurovum sp.]
MRKTYYLYADENTAFVEEYKEYLDERGVTSLPFSQIEQFDIDQASHILVTGTLEEIKEVLMIAEHSGATIGIIPKPEQKQLIKTFYLPTDTQEAIDLALTPSEKKIDLCMLRIELFCRRWWLEMSLRLISMSRYLKERAFGRGSNCLARHCNG